MIRITEINGTPCRSYLLESGEEALLVDPVRERLDTYQLILASRGLRLVRVIETHMHADHLMMNRAMKMALGAPVAMFRASPSPLVDHHLREGEELRLGSETLKVLHTPGHTPDSISLYTGDAVLTGDVLLIGGSGRTDFPGGDAGAQFDAVTERLFVLPDATVVWPAHDYNAQLSSTIGREKAENSRFSGRTRAEYIELMGSLGLPFPEKIQKALQVNQSGFESDEVAFPGVADVARLESMDATAVSRWLASAKPPLVIDVREPEEFVGELGHLPGSLLVPLDALQQRLPKLLGYVDRDIVMVCRAGARSATAGAILHGAGFRRIVNLEGGMLAWVAAALPVQR